MAPIPALPTSSTSSTSRAERSTFPLRTTTSRSTPWNQPSNEKRHKEGERQREESSGEAWHTRKRERTIKKILTSCYKRVSKMRLLCSWMLKYLAFSIFIMGVFL